jgi:DmsE family decaheme c-type cytochrome
MRMRRSIGIAFLLILLELAGPARAASDGQATAPPQSAPAETSAAEDAQSCSPCHGEIAQQLRAHPHTSSGKPVSCSDCHAVGSSHLSGPREAPLSAQKPLSVPEQNAACARCHASDAGPFVHEHAVVKVEGCASCHAAHGSANPKMLTTGGSALCLQCHAQTTARVPHAASSEPAAQPVDCTTCHRQIHGSNTSEVFLQ